MNIWQSAKRTTHTEEHTQRSKCVKFQDSYFENHPGMPRCHNRILFHYEDILWAAMHRDYRDCVNFVPKECSS